MLTAARFAESLLADPLFGKHYHDAFIMPPVMALNQVNKEGLAGALTALAATLVLNAPPAISRRVLVGVVKPGRWIANRHRRCPTARSSARSPRWAMSRERAGWARRTTPAPSQTRNAA